MENGSGCHLEGLQAIEMFGNPMDQMYISPTGPLESLVSILSLISLCFMKLSLILNSINSQLVKLIFFSNFMPCLNDLSIKHRKGGGVG